MRRVCAAIERGNAGRRVEGDGRNFIWKVLSLRKEIWEVDSVLRAVIGASRGVDAKPRCVMAGREKDLVGHFFAERVHVVERRGLVRAAVNARNVAVVRCRKRVVLMVEEVDQTKADIVFFSWNDIEIAAVDLLLFGVGSGGEKICAAKGEVWRW